MNRDPQSVRSTWLASLTKPAFDLRANEAAFCALRQGQEGEAASIIAGLLDDTIPAGIESCSRRGSNSLTLPMPASVLGTDAFNRLRSWLSDQGLDSALTGFEVDDYGKTQAALTIMPAGA